MVTETDHKFILPDARVLTWREYGDPEGHPTLWFHGLPGSRIEAVEADKAAVAAGVRIIAFDRPGCGQSAPRPKHYGFDSLASDVARLLDGLRIGRVSIVAYSGGAPFALRTVALLGRDRVARLALISGIAPSQMPGRTKESSRAPHVLSWLSHRVPPAARVLVGDLVRTAQQQPDRAAANMNSMFASPADQSMLDDSSKRDALTANLAEAGRYGATGIVSDLALCRSQRVDGLSEIDVPVRLWHGEGDRSVPVGHARWIANQVSIATLTVWPNVGHLHNHERWVEVFADIAAHTDDLSHDGE